MTRGKVAVVVGTRPEVIKLAPVVLALRQSRQLAPVVISTGQHRTMLDQSLAVFGIAPDRDLDLMMPGQSLEDLTARALVAMKEALAAIEPCWVVVQGDTTTALAAAMAAFYARVPVAHVEAGLRSGERYSPFPEEINRRMIDQIAELLLAPTRSAADQSIRMQDAPEVVAALEYMIARGGVMVMHGYTHQWARRLNPYTAVSADDTEFYRVIENEDHSLSYTGPLPKDSVTWATRRIGSARRLLRDAGLPRPRIFEFPHYAGSVASYQAVAATFNTRWERSLYAPGLLTGQAPDYGQIFGQLFPYPVRDVYGTRVLPENLGNIEPDWFYIFPPRFPADIINAAEKNLVVRDGVAGFYFHPFFDLDYLRETVDGIRALGYTFVSPASL